MKFQCLPLARWLMDGLLMLLRGPRIHYIAAWLRTKKVKALITKEMYSSLQFYEMHHLFFWNNLESPGLTHAAIYSQLSNMLEGDSVGTIGMAGPLSLLWSVILRFSTAWRPYGNFVWGEILMHIFKPMSWIWCTSDLMEHFIGGHWCKSINDPNISIYISYTYAHA